MPPILPPPVIHTKSGFVTQTQIKRNAPAQTHNDDSSNDDGLDDAPIQGANDFDFGSWEDDILPKDARPYLAGAQ